MSKVRVYNGTMVNDLMCLYDRDSAPKEVTVGDTKTIDLKDGQSFFQVEVLDPGDKTEYWYEIGDKRTYVDLSKDGNPFRVKLATGLALGDPDTNVSIGGGQN
ncbi:MAG: hypothetical protein GY940_30075 [bacterium]|nr:hypothetical protein [bacterium]